MKKIAKWERDLIDEARELCGGGWGGKNSWESTRRGGLELPLHGLHLQKALLS